MTPVGNKEFSAYVTEQVGWYVYALRDPRDGKVFYIGKGQGNRVFAHANGAVAEEGDDVSQKIAMIKEIHNAGKQVDTLIIRHGIKTGSDAYVVESALIDLLYLLDKDGSNDLFQITNLVKGHDYQALGCMSTNAVIAQYDAEPCPEITEPVMLLKIPVRWFPQMTDEELFESTHGWWKVGERRNKAKYAFAVRDGVIRGIYEIYTWRPRAKGDRGFIEGEKGRFGFSGAPTSEIDKYLNKSVKHLYKVGEQSPFKYINC